MSQREKGIKICLVGPRSGKTAFIHSILAHYCHERFVDVDLDNYKPTRGYKLYCFDKWATSKQSYFIRFFDIGSSQISSPYIQGVFSSVDIILLFFDVKYDNCDEEMHQWRQVLSRHVSRQTPIFLLSTQSTLGNREDVEHALIANEMKDLEFVEFFELPDVMNILRAELEGSAGRNVCVETLRHIMRLYHLSEGRRPRKKKNFLKRQRSFVMADEQIVAPMLDTDADETLEAMRDAVFSKCTVDDSIEISKILDTMTNDETEEWWIRRQMKRLEHTLSLCESLSTSVTQQDVSVEPANVPRESTEFDEVGSFSLGTARMSLSNLSVVS
ncbi:hypothetical protein PCE1_002041 [Barthelona sp. PCE]